MAEPTAMEDDLTPAERAYLNSRGTNTDGLDAAVPPQPAPTSVPTPAPAPPAAEVTPPQPPVPAINDDEVELETPQQPQQKRKYVNFNRFKRVEDELAAARGDLAKERERATRFDERVRLINEALAQQPVAEPPAEDPDPAPDPEQDIFGFVRWQSRQLERVNQEISGFRTAQQEAREAAQTTEWYRGQARAYAQEEPTFGHAYNFLLENRMRELEAGGVGEPGPAGAQARMRIVVDEERQVVDAARRAGENPAKRVFALAVGRGFDKSKVATNGAAAPTNGAAAPAPAANQAPGTPLGGTLAPAAAPAAPNVAAEIAAIKNAQPAATSLSAGGGGGPMALTAQQLADMSEEEFRAAVSQMSKSRQREIFGS